MDDRGLDPLVALWQGEPNDDLVKQEAIMLPRKGGGVFSELVADIVRAVIAASLVGLLILYVKLGAEIASLAVVWFALLCLGTLWRAWTLSKLNAEYSNGDLLSTLPSMMRRLRLVVWTRVLESIFSLGLMLAGVAVYSGAILPTALCAAAGAFFLFGRDWKQRRVVRAELQRLEVVHGDIAPRPRPGERDAGDGSQQ